MEVRLLLKHGSGVKAGCFRTASFTALKQRVFFCFFLNKTGVFISTNVTGSTERAAYRRLHVIRVSDNSSEPRPRPREGQQRLTAAAEAFGDSRGERHVAKESAECGRIR